MNKRRIKGGAGKRETVLVVGGRKVDVTVETIGGQEGVLVATPSGLETIGEVDPDARPSHLNRLVKSTASSAKLSRSFERMEQRSLKQLEDRISSLDLKVRNLQADNARREYFRAMGIAPEDNGRSLAVPLRVYLGDESGRTRFESVMQQADDLFEIEVMLDGVKSSWLQDGWVKFRDDYLPLAEGFLQGLSVDKVRASNDNKDAETIKILAESIKGQKKAAVELGHIVVLQYVDAAGDSVFWAKKLSKEQALFFESDPLLLKDPERLHESMMLVAQGVRVLPNTP